MSSISCWKRIFVGFIGIILALCANEPKAMASNSAPKNATASNASSKKDRRVVIVLSDIKGGVGGRGNLFVYEGDKMIRRFDASGGKVGHATREGNFKIYYRKADQTSSIYGHCIDKMTEKARHVENGDRACKPSERYKGYSIPHFQAFDGDIGIHESSDYLKSSHGCIRVSKAVAKALWELIDVGTPVEVTTFGAMNRASKAKHASKGKACIDGKCVATKVESAKKSAKASRAKAGQRVGQTRRGK